MNEIYRLIAAILTVMLLSGCEIIIGEMIRDNDRRVAEKNAKSEIYINLDELENVKTIAIVGIYNPPPTGDVETSVFCGLDFGIHLQEYLKQFFEENSFKVVVEPTTVIENRSRRSRKNLSPYFLLKAYEWNDYASLDNRNLKNVDAYLIIVPLQFRYSGPGGLNFSGEHHLGPDIMVIARLVSARTKEVIYSGTIKYGWEDKNSSYNGTYIESPKQHIYVSRENFQARKKEAEARLLEGIEFVAFRIAENIIRWEFRSVKRLPAENIASNGSDNFDCTDDKVTFQNIGVVTGSKESLPVTEFYGQAEEEINTNTYDKHLWGKIAQRIEKGGSMSATSLPEQSIPSVGESNSVLSGTYVSEITHKELPSYLKAKAYFGRQSKIEVKIKQDGNAVTGTISGDRVGEIDGVRIGNKIKFNWYIEGNSVREGKGVWWVINDDPFKLNGTWKIKGGANSRGIWNLRRIE